MLADSARSVTEVPDKFYQEIKQILEKFYDFPYLNNHPMAHAIQIPRIRPGENDGQRLRRAFLGALEEMKPGSEAAQKSPQARYYSLINLRYIESDTMQHVAHELGISERQAYRDLKKAEENLAELLWERVGRDIYRMEVEAPSDANETGPSVETMELQLRPVTAQDLIHNACRAIERLALQQRIQVVLDMPEPGVVFSTDPRLAQQVLISLLSQLLQNAPTDQLTLSLERQAGQVVIRFHFRLTGQRQNLAFDHPLTGRFIEQLHWKLEIADPDGAGNQTVCLRAGGTESVLLVIDDHPPLIELLRRYLTQTRCQVIGVSDGQQGLSLAASLHPDVILLDVMMPEIDGWEVLQRLRNSPLTTQIPVVICSIFNDPKLAYSLGATALLTKPVQREKLFEVLKNLKLIG